MKHLRCCQFLFELYEPNVQVGDINPLRIIDRHPCAIPVLGALIINSVLEQLQFIIIIFLAFTIRMFSDALLCLFKVQTNRTEFVMLSFSVLTDLIHTARGCVLRFS